MNGSEELTLIRATLSNLERTLLAAGIDPQKTRQVISALSPNSTADATAVQDALDWIEDAMNEIRGRAHQLAFDRADLTAPPPRSGPRR